MAFKIGDKVKWESQAGGNWREKVGEVVYVFQKKSDGIPYRIAASKFPNHARMFDGANVTGNTYPGYLVSVPPPEGTKAKSRLYLPRPSKLEKI